MPQILPVVEAPFGLDPVVDVAIPLAAWLEPCRSDAICALEDKAERGVLDVGVCACEPLAVHVAPGAQRMELQAYRVRRSHDAMDDGHSRAPMNHRDSAFNHHVADGPPPPRQSVLEAEALEVHV